MTLWTVMFSLSPGTPGRRQQKPRTMSLMRTPALLASYIRAFTGNIYWTAVGHYLSNAYWSWYALKRGKRSEDVIHGLPRMEPAQSHGDQFRS